MASDHQELVRVFMGSDAIVDAGRGLEEALVVVVWGFFWFPVWVKVLRVRARRRRDRKLLKCRVSWRERRRRKSSSAAV
jgi:hypothetical protein